MSLSVGLSLYHLAGRRDARPRPVWAQRPPGRLVWLHCGAGSAGSSMRMLARRLIAEDGVSVLLSASDAPGPAAGAAAAPGPNPGLNPGPNPSLPPSLPPGLPAPFAGALAVQAPLDTPAETAAFLDHWRPEVLVTSEGELRPALLAEAEQRGLPALLVDGRAPGLMAGRDGWYPGLLRGALTSYRRISVIDDAAARAFRRAGASADQIRIAGRMEEESAALPCVEAEREALARLLATRPVWLAVGVSPAEEEAVFAAHAEALRLAHRLLLIVLPADPARAAGLAAELERDRGWMVAQRAVDQEPDAETEVFLADNEGELGLWYRLAPVTFLGGSLAGPGCARNPLEAAALGSAILYGPRAGAHGAVFGRLGAARAARMVGSSQDLALALADLLSPDRAARAAQAAWTVASEGSEVTEAVLADLRRLMDGEPL